MADLKLNFLHVCDTAFPDQNGNLNIIGIFEYISNSSFPFVYPRITVVFNIGGTAGKHAFVVRMVSAKDDKELFRVGQDFELKDSKHRFGSISGFGNVKFEKEGLYKIEVIGDDKKLGEVEIDVRKIPLTTTKKG